MNLLVGLYPAVTKVASKRQTAVDPLVASWICTLMPGRYPCSSLSYYSSTPMASKHQAADHQLAVDLFVYFYRADRLLVLLASLSILLLRWPLSARSQTTSWMCTSSYAYTQVAVVSPVFLACNSSTWLASKRQASDHQLAVDLVVCFYSGGGC